MTIFIIPLDLVPPVLYPSLLMLREGDNASVFCHSTSPRSLEVRELWLDPNGVRAEESNSRMLMFQNINRTQAGTYTCVLMTNSQNASVNITVVVVDCKFS